MSGVYTRTVVVRTVLGCDARGCAAEWVSEKHGPGYHERDREVARAVAFGWRVYAAARGQRTYCPAHEPTVPMRLVHGAEPGDSR